MPTVIVPVLCGPLFAATAKLTLPLALPGVPLSPATQDEVPSMPGLHPLDLILLASLFFMWGFITVINNNYIGVFYVGAAFLLFAVPTAIFVVCARASAQSASVAISRVTCVGSLHPRAAAHPSRKPVLAASASLPFRSASLISSPNNAAW